jgi:heme/copper-type cytochrome/quinol oxidase subunit 3
VYAQYYYIRLIVLGVLVLLDVYGSGLWFFAYVRTALPFCSVLALASLGALFGAVIATAFAYDLAGIKRFDPANIIYGFSFFVIQPFVALVAVVGQTWLVICLIRAKASKSPEI